MFKLIKKKASSSNSLFKDFILGGQDGLVEVLGLSLGLGIATGSTRIVLIAGLASTLSESISMGAVAYTSSEAEQDYYKSIKINSKLSKKLIHPLKSAWVVLVASIIGSLIPLAPFFFMSVSSAMVYSSIVTALALFITGALESRINNSHKWFSKGLRLTIIGLVAASIGLLVGWVSNMF